MTGKDLEGTLEAITNVAGTGVLIHPIGIQQCRTAEDADQHTRCNDVIL